jgi:60 kDa SS-A/Ro ribonucleoprotein
MVMDALGTISTKKTPQNEQARADQKPDNAGGFGFTVSDHAYLNRFLTLGTEGGTFYVREKALTRQAAGHVIALAEQGDPMLLSETIAVSEAGRAPRNNPALFALAVQASMGPEAARKAALDALPRVARTGGHMLSFVPYAEQFRGWGPALCKAIGRWYTGDVVPEGEETEDTLRRDVGEIAYQCLKYKQRDGWSQGDILKLAHYGRRPLGLERKELFSYLITGTPLGEAVIPLVQAAAACHATREVKEWVRLIGENPSLTWEMLPSEAQAHAAVWEALIAAGMPLRTMLNKLGQMSSHGVFTPMGGTTNLVVSRLTDMRQLQKARIHPISVLIALRTYASGHGMRGGGQWTVVTPLADALDDAFYRSFGFISPSHKRTVIGVDCSGSMDAPIGGTVLTAREAAAAIALITVVTEPHTAVMGFCGQFVPLDISPKMRLDAVMAKMNRYDWESTDCAVPMLWAMKHKVQADVFEVITDNETWYGSIHPHQALEQYRRATGIAARQVVVATTPTDITIADPLDPLTMDVSGFDAAVPKLIADFSRGEL